MTDTNKKEYVIFCYYQGIAGGEYYVGEGSYTYQGEKYRVVKENINEAKKYKSKKAAINAANKMVASCVNISNPQIAEIECKE